MTPFLYKVAEVFFKEYSTDLYKHTFVFPNRRAAMFFQKYLAEIAGKPLFSPSMLTIQELFSSLSSLQPADRIEMLVMLYNHFSKISGSDESFDDFLYWGEMLLNDFDDADKYLADAKQLFRNVQNFRSLDDDLSHLDEKQVEAIRRFWTNFMPSDGNPAKEKFQETWKILYELYVSFRSELFKKGHAYEGMIFRDVAESVKNMKIDEWQTEGYIFVGLNALTPAEITLLTHLKNIGKADFYWDYDSPFVHDDLNRASLRVEENLTRFTSRFNISDYSLIKSETEYVPLKQKLEVIGVPSGVGQAKFLTQVIKDLIKSKDIPEPDEAINTAVVLPDENLLLPVLYSIPEEIGKINVTMGYSLSNSSIAGLIEHIALMQQNIRKWNGEPAFYHRYVNAVLNQPLVARTAGSDAEQLKNHILNYNRIVIPVSEIPSNPFLKLIFTPVEDWRSIGDYLHKILSGLYNSLTAEKHVDNEIDKSEDIDVVIVTDNKGAGTDDLEREFIVQYYKTVTRLQDTLSEAGNMSVDTYFRLLKKLAHSITVSFRGEPLSGLQVMGVLETRAVDFENLIILSFNEGVFPLKSSANSFIPFTLRKGFGLPVYEHQDSVYAYHFYRMISRARRVFLLYDTRTDGLQTGEVSRYFYQLKYLYNDYFDIDERVVSYDVTTPQISPVSVEKTDDVMNKLNDFRQGGDKSLSASHINNYIDCPLKFYFTAIEGLSEESEVQESVESDVFGSIFHRLMEIIYQRYNNKVVTNDVLNELVTNDDYLTEIIEKAFAHYYFKDKENPRLLEGQYYLIGEILRSYVKQTLKTDRQFAPFTYISSEYRFNRAYRINDELTVNFKGSIDRIDRVGDSVRIIDYKTGSGKTTFTEIPELFDASKSKRPYQILQVFVYGLFYLLENPATKLSPAVYYLRDVFKDFNPTVCTNSKPVDNLSAILPEFREIFDDLIKEIFNPEVPFSQTQNNDNCKWCAFKGICNK
ncbi:MAG: PD-(D/E)XK nuclease family protein [Fermentimonas sp.]|nr:PD-(D/E)XK nuclease family protein [Fermentimonas sp.]